MRSENPPLRPRVPLEAMIAQLSDDDLGRLSHRNAVLVASAEAVVHEYLSARDDGHLDQEAREAAVALYRHIVQDLQGCSLFSSDEVATLERISAFDPEEADALLEEWRMVRALLADERLRRVRAEFASMTVDQRSGYRRQWFLIQDLMRAGVDALETAIVQGLEHQAANSSARDAFDKRRALLVAASVFSDAQLARIPERFHAGEARGYLELLDGLASVIASSPVNEDSIRTLN